MIAAAGISRPAPVPAEFVGLARVFRNQVGEAAYGLAERTAPLLGPLRRACEVQRRPRPSELALVAREWRGLPGAALLSSRAQAWRHRLLIEDVRVCPSTLQEADWPTPEPGIMVTSLVVNIAPRQFSIGARFVAHVFLHAMARRLERGVPCDTAALKADLALLAEHVGALGPAAEDLETLDVPATGGVWIARMVETDDHEGRRVRIPAVRTFLTEHQARIRTRLR